VGPARRGSRLRPGEGRWAQALLVAAALAAALAGLHVTLQGLSWWFVGTAYAASVLLAAALTRSLVRSAFWPPIVSLAAGVALLTLGYAADTALLGIIPTPATLARFGTLVNSGVTSIVEQRVPATPELGIVLLIAVLMVVCAWAADLALATRHPALIAAPLAAILVVPMAIKPGLADAFWYLVTAALYLAVLRIGRRRDSRRVVLVTGGILVLGSLLLPYALPGVDARDAPRVSGLRTGLNPLISLGDDLRRGDPMLALSYTTSAQEPVYLRLTTLETFTGETWGPIVGSAQGGDLTRFPAPTGLGGATPYDEATVDVTVSDVITNWLPAPYPTTSVTGLTGEWFWEPDGLTVRSVETGARGQRYQASFLELAPTSAQLAVATSRDAPAGTLELPDGVPEIIPQTAHAVADGAASSYDKALALQTYLRSEPFEYSEQAPVDEGFDGSGMDALAVFLDRKVGYCVHYASAMAVMARELGIPSRIAVGFQPGDRQFADGSNVYSVSTDDLHAWPELYFDGIGWLRFEPTPGRGAVPDYGTQPVDDPNTPQDESSPTPSALPTSATDARGDRDETPQTPEQLAAQQGASALVSLGVLAAVLLVALTPAGFRAAVRRGRIRRIRQGGDAAAAAWEEVRDTARDVGWSAPESETPRTFAARIAAELGAEGAIGAFRGHVEANAYGRPDAAALSPAELAAVRREILRSADLRTRLRAFLLPPSLLYRWRPDDR
ncbi:transglutaminase domain-containing protein, partial [Schumannella luteola]